MDVQALAQTFFENYVALAEDFGVVVIVKKWDELQEVQRAHYEATARKTLEQLGKPGVKITTVRTTVTRKIRRGDK